MLDPDGSISRWKARPLVKCYKQEYGIYYTETFSPIVNHQSIRTLLAIAVVEDLDIHQIDIQTTFLNGYT